MAIFGAVGSGTTSALVHPFARQWLGWQAANPERCAAARVLEVKGDVCHDMQHLLVDHHRAEDDAAAEAWDALTTHAAGLADAMGARESPGPA